MYLLDTNVISELRKLGTARADPNVTAWVNAASADSFVISAVSVMEMQMGIHRIAHRGDVAQARLLEAWLHNYILPAFEGRILPCDTAVALQCAALHVPDPASERDAWIAATAMVHDLAVVTRNVADFQHSKVRIINPWEPTPQSGKQP